MSRYANWTAWDLDVWTWGWIAWLVFFPVWETLSGKYANLEGDFEMLTNHLRPIFLNVPVVWWISLGLWLWLGVHLLAPTVESWVFQAVRG